MNELLIILLLILFNGILSMSEIALISARKTFLANEVKRGSKSAKTALKLANEPDKFLSTVQIGITVIGILTGLYSGSVLADDFADVLKNWGVPASYAYRVSQISIVVFVTYLTLIFGELVPKRIGMSISEKASKIVARPMYLLSLIASPFVWILSKSTAFIFNLFGFKSEIAKVTESEIKSLIEEGYRDGEIQEVEQDILERVFILGDLRVSSLMTYRSDVIALDVQMSNDEIKSILKGNLYDIYPVIDKNFDNVKGVVLLNDLIFSIDQPDFKLENIIVSAPYFHERMSVYKVLEQMKKEGISTALIFDEFGSCQGVIRLRDILEGLVGTIEDTHTEPDIIKRANDEGWLVDGQCLVYDFLSYFEREDLYEAEEDYDTVGGLILDQLQHLPISGEQLVWNQFNFEIVDMDGARIDKILVTILEHNNSSEQERSDD